MLNWHRLDQLWIQAGWTTLFKLEAQVRLYLLSYIVKNSPNAGEWAIRAEPLISMVDDDFETDYNRDINLALPPKPPI